MHASRSFWFTEQLFFFLLSQTWHLVPYRHCCRANNGILRSTGRWKAPNSLIQTVLLQLFKLEILYAKALFIFLFFFFFSSIDLCNLLFSDEWKIIPWFFNVCCVHWALEQHDTDKNVLVNWLILNTKLRITNNYFFFLFCYLACLSSLLMCKRQWYQRHCGWVALTCSPKHWKGSAMVLFLFLHEGSCLWLVCFWSPLEREVSSPVSLHLVGTSLKRNM